MAQQGVLSLGVGNKMVDRDHTGQPEHLTQVTDVALQVCQAAIQRGQVFNVQRIQVNATVVLQRPHGGNDDSTVGAQPALAALDIDELLCPQISAEAGLGDHIVAQLQRRLGRNHTVAAVRNIGERAAVQDGRIVLQRLHQVRCQRVLQQHGHRAVHLQVGGAHRLAVTRLGHHDTTQPRLQIGQRVGQTEDGHDLGGDDNVKAVLARKAVARSAQSGSDAAQRTVVHVNHPLPGDAPRINAQRVAVMDVIVDGCGQQVVGRCDGREITGEMEVDVLHRHHLRVAAAGRSALHAEHRTKAGLAQRDHRLLADMVQCVAQAHRRGGLALSGPRGADRGNQHQLAIGPIAQRRQIAQVDLRLVMAIGHQLRVGNAQTVSRQIGDSAQGGALGNLDIAKWQGRLRWAGRRGGLRRCRAPLGPSGSPGRHFSVLWLAAQDAEQRIQPFSGYRRSNKRSRLRR